MSEPLGTQDDIPNDPRNGASVDDKGTDIYKLITHTKLYHLQTNPENQKSQRRLTVEEKKTRHQHNKKRTTMAEAVWEALVQAKVDEALVGGMSHRQALKLAINQKVQTHEEVLQTRILPCLLDDVEHSSAYPTERHRVFPQDARAWNAFDNSVAQHKADPKGKLKQPTLHPFNVVFNSARPAKDEGDEFSYLKNVVLPYLPGTGTQLVRREGDHLCQVGPVNQEHSKSGPAVIECKTSQILRFPESAAEVVNAYKNATNVYVTKHLGQLVGSILFANASYGVLTSGTGTYFVWLQKLKSSDNTMPLHIAHVSAKWFFADKNYFRAWYRFMAFVKANKIDSTHGLAYDLNTAVGQSDSQEGSTRASASTHRGHGQDGYVSPTEEMPEGSTHAATPTRQARHSREKREGRTMDSQAVDELLFNKSHSTQVMSGKRLLPIVELADVVLDGTILGTGRNGCVYRAMWGGKKVALKAFGSLHDFGKELEAYCALEQLQGEVLPTVHFVTFSQSRRVGLIGLECGVPVTGEEEGLDMEKVAVMKRLKDNGWMQPPDECKNDNFIWLQRGSSSRTLAAIDLEMFESSASSDDDETSAEGEDMLM